MARLDGRIGGLESRLREDTGKMESRLREDTSQLRDDIKQLGEQRILKTWRGWSMAKRSSKGCWKDCARPSPGGSRPANERASVMNLGPPDGRKPLS